MNIVLRKTLRKALSRLAAVVFSTSALLATGQANAHDGPHAPGVTHNNRMDKPVAWRFTLATLEADRFVHSSDFAGPVLVNFWSRDCPPCIAELPRLQAFANTNKNWTVLLIATDSARDAKSFLDDRGVTLTSLRAGTDSRALMRAAGNPSGALPYSRAQMANSACFAKLGELSESDFDKIPDSCGQQPTR